MTAPIFNNEDRLRLLQLQAKRAIADRRTAPGAEADDGSASVPQPAEYVSVPERWRLVPEGAEPYAWQAEALPLWLKEGRGTIKVATGGGKTRFALMAAEVLQNQRVRDLRLVIVVPTIPLLFQWRGELEASNLPASSIGLMGGDQQTPALDHLHVLICVLASARDRLPSLVTKAGWQDRMLLVVDECHRANAEHARRIFESRPAYVLGLSATPEDQDDESEFPSNEAYAQSAVGQGLGPICYEFTLKQSLEAGLLTPFEIWHVGLPLTADELVEHAGLSRDIRDLHKVLEAAFARSRSKQVFISWCQSAANRGGPMAAEAQRFIGLAGERKRLLYRAESRRRLTLAVLQAGLADPDSRAIVFHESVDEIEDVFLAVLEANLPAVLEHSKLPDRLRAEGVDAFRRGVARAIVSVKSLVEGFNVPSADLGVIVASSGSVRQRIQSLGRMLRRKEVERLARVWVFYVRDSEDEIIYQKTDWDHVVGTSVNRYFRWDPAESGAWQDTLLEQGAPPRRFRPASRDVDAGALTARSPYPGRNDGCDVKVDQQGNARLMDTNAVVTMDPSLIAAIIELNPFRRAHITRAGHLIVRVANDRANDDAWLFLAQVALSAAPVAREVRVELKLVSRSGRRRIAWVRGREERHALGPDPLVTSLLEWASQLEAIEGISRVSKLCWDERDEYWVEAQGKRFEYPGPSGRLEFAD